MKGKAWYLFGVIVIVGLVIAIIVVNITPKVKVLSLSESDFKILNIVWDTYRMEYFEGQYIPSTFEYDWDMICNCPEKPCETSAWHVTLQASEELVCTTLIDGIPGGGNLDEGSGWIIPEGVGKFHFPEGEIDHVHTNFDVTKDHEIIICCISETKEGKICKDIILPAKC